MLAGIRKRLARRHLDIKECEDEAKDDLHSTFVPPPNYIKISQGKIQLVHQSKSLDIAAEGRHHKPSQEVLESRILELEGALLRIQEKVNNSQCGSPTFERELREQLENMHRVMKSKERKTMRTCRDYKVLQARFCRQESLLQALQLENRNLIMRICQYEHCLDDVMRKVVDAIVAEDNLREEVSMLKSRVRDLEEQNAALSTSPAKGRDEGYCTMSSGQPQPSNSHLEDLPEEPEQWLLPTEPCPAEMEDWSMSQEELAVITLNDEREHQLHQQQLRQQGRSNIDHNWIWDSNDFLNSTSGILETDSVSDGISQLLQQKIVYSEDEEVACTEFTNDFYKLVNIRGSGSSNSLYSYVECETDDDDDEDDSSLTEGNVRLRHRIDSNDHLNVQSPTPSEVGHVQVTSCSSSESDELSRCFTHNKLSQPDVLGAKQDESSEIEIEGVQLNTNPVAMNENLCIGHIIKTELRRNPLVKSKSLLEEHKPSCLLRNNQRREIESSVVCNASVNATPAFNEKSGLTGNFWRRSHGWKRVTSPILTTTGNVSLKKETKAEISRTFQLPQKALPTRIPQAQPTQHTSLLMKQQKSTYKSKIPPPFLCKLKTTNNLKTKTS